MTWESARVRAQPPPNRETSGRRPDLSNPAARQGCTLPAKLTRAVAPDHQYTQLLILGTTRPPKMTETRTTPRSAKGNRSGFDGRFSFTWSALAVPGFDNALSRMLLGFYSQALNAVASG